MVVLEEQREDEQVEVEAVMWRLSRRGDDRWRSGEGVEAVFYHLFSFSLYTLIILLSRS